MTLKKTYDANPEAALEITAPAVEFIRNRNEKARNLSYRQLVGQRVDCRLSLNREADAQRELEQLHDDLEKTGANPLRRFA